FRSQITLLSPLTVSKSMTITDATGAGPVMITGSGSSSLFVTTASVSLKLRYLTLANGQSSLDGGAIQFFGGTLTLDHVTMQNNRATRRGGAIVVQNTGSILANDSMFLDNVAGGGGTADAYGAAVFATAAGTLNFNRCTFSHNVAAGSDTIGPAARSGFGGALAGIAANISLLLTNCTFDAN